MCRVLFFSNFAFWCSLEFYIAITTHIVSQIFKYCSKTWSADHQQVCRMFVVVLDRIIETNWNVNITVKIEERFGSSAIGKLHAVEAKRKLCCGLLMFIKKIEYWMVRFTHGIHTLVDNTAKRFFCLYHKRVTNLYALINNINPANEVCTMNWILMLILQKIWCNVNINFS